MASEGSASAFVDDLGFVKVLTFGEFMRPGRRPGAFAVIKSVLSPLKCPRARGAEP